MIDDVESIPTWPVVAIALHGDGSVSVDGDPLVLAPGDNARNVAMEQARRTAELLGRPVRVDACEPDGTVYPMVVDGTGDVAEAGPPVVPGTQRRGLLRRRSAAPTPRPARSAGGPPVPAPPRAPAPREEPRPSDGPQPFADEVPPPAAAFRSAGPVLTKPAPHAAPGDPAPPYPTEEQARVLARVRRTAEAGDPRGALPEVLDLARDAEGGAAGALLEVQAYLTFLDGDSAGASRLYIEIASDPARWISAAWALGLVECAHHCWLDVDDPGEAYELGSALVSAYVRLGAADSVQIAHVRARQKEIRARLGTA